MKGVEVGGIKNRKLRIAETENTRFYVTVSRGKRNIRIHEKGRERKRRRRDRKGVGA